MTCGSKLTYCSTVIKRRGFGISPGYHKINVAQAFVNYAFISQGYFHRKIEISVISLIWSDLNCHKMLNFQHLVYSFLNFNTLVERFSKLEIFPERYWEFKNPPFTCFRKSLWVTQHSKLTALWTKMLQNCSWLCLIIYESTIIIIKNLAFDYTDNRNVT